ncbi:photoreceptor cilium actin regulator [Microcaecilia unicolor]|uniref:Photoreceptor cilium actin regulator n=1 Tax=Microcaecilia unicolor TaxID=1415580 RepID=A0A6P7XIN7_9AMPH|nr:photoreceptor cilium actin regulator [Microcaecilia unicolor]
MGCAPSQSSIIHAITKNASRPLKTHKNLLLPQQENEGSPVPLPVKSLNSYDTEGDFNQEAALCKQGLQENNQKTFGQDKNVPIITKRFLLRNSSLPDIPKEKKIEKPTTKAEMVVSKLINYQKYNAGDIQLQKQSSAESELLLSQDERSESNQKKGRRSKKLGKQGEHTRLREKRRLKCNITKKVDFPDLLVRAHQSAYAFLNPNLSKYEAIVSVANEATETQLILQQMVSFLVLRFAEMNHLLQEIADEGENLLKKVGKNLAWPHKEGDPKEQPDLLQQLLQYTINKMQVINDTVALLTSNTLQETCSYLESAANNLQEKLKSKQQLDDRLLRIMKLLEGYTVAHHQSNPHDLALYSEDSGIGVDNESFKPYSFSERPKHFKEVCYLANSSDEIPTYPAATHTNNSSMPACFSLVSSLSLNSLDSLPTLNGDSSKDSQSTDSTEDNDCCDEDGENERLSEMLKMTLPRRPMTSPAKTSEHRLSSKRLENPKNEEMTQKIKHSISEKIKFVPVKLGNNTWPEEEQRKRTLTRSSSASGCIKSTARQKRSRSLESLKSQAEDPTLLELQRTQKEITKRLEKLNLINRNKDMDGKEESLRCRLPATLQEIDHSAPSFSTNKLKASLNKNILPNQDKVTLSKCEKSLTSITPTPEVDCREENETLVTSTLENGCLSPQYSVKKLIEAFSSTEVMVKQTDVRSLGPLKCVRKCGVPVLLSTILVCKQLEPLNHKPVVSPAWNTNHSQTCTSQCMFSTAFQPVRTTEISRNESNEETADNLESLPPPPLEILMDNSFQLSAEAKSQEDSVISIDTKSETVNLCAQIQPVTPRKMSVSQKMKVSLKAIDLLPSKNVTSTNITLNKILRNSSQDSHLRKHSLELHHANMHVSEQENAAAMQRNLEMEQAAHLYKQSHKKIPLPHPGDAPKTHSSGESKELCAKTALMQHQMQSSPSSLRKSVKLPLGARKGSTTRMPSSTLTENMLTRSLANQNHAIQAPTPVQPRPSSIQRQVSPPVSPKIQSPPARRKLSSPPAQQKMPSSLLARRQQSPPTQHKLPSPPTNHRISSPPPPSASCSSPISTSLSSAIQHNSVHSSNEFYSSSKFVSNAQSIFCPALTSLFEAKQPSPTSISNTEAGNQSQSPASSWRNNSSLKQCGDQQRRMALSAANPQPFVRRCYSDRRPGVKLQLPASVSALANSEPVVQSVTSEGASQKDGEARYSQRLAELKGSTRSESHPELCIVGQGLQKEE